MKEKKIKVIDAYGTLHGHYYPALKTFSILSSIGTETYRKAFDIPYKIDQYRHAVLCGAKYFVLHDALTGDTFYTTMDSLHRNSLSHLTDKDRRMLPLSEWFVIVERELRHGFMRDDKIKKRSNAAKKLTRENKKLFNKFVHIIKEFNPNAKFNYTQQDSLVLNDINQGGEGQSNISDVPGSEDKE